MKNKVELKSWFEDGKLYLGEYVKHKINQLDEPEVLSQEWIDENKKDSGVHYIGYYVPIGRLHDLLVPKQEEIIESFKETVRKLVETSELAMDVQKLTGMTLEEIKEEARNGGFVPKQELPVIPKFVAEHIENRRGESLARAYNVPIVTKVGQWLLDKKNCETFARAWLDGYEVEVEEEQKYIVVLGKSIYNTTTYGQIGEVNSKKIMQSVYANEESIIAPNQYTKSEILEVKDGEGIFKRFAVKVEELEE